MHSRNTTSKILNALLVLTSLAGYLEWGIQEHAFLLQAEYQIFLKLLDEPVSVVHPFTMLPLAGQLILVTTLFQKNPSKMLTYFGLAGIGILLVLMFAIGLISLNVKITASTLPFLLTAWVTIKHIRKNPES